MKTIIKLVVVLAILNAAARGAIAAWTFYEFRDAAQQLVIFGVDASTDELRAQIIERASDLDVPLNPDNVTIRREGPRTWADAAYVQPVELFPRFIYPVNLSFSVEGFNAVGAVR